MKIVKVIKIVHDNLFECLLQNFCYIVVRANNMVFEFTISYFSLIDLNDLIMVTEILSNVDVAKTTQNNKDTLVSGFARTKAFLDSYYEYLAIIDIDIALDINKTSKVPQYLLKRRMNIIEFEVSEIIH